MIKTTTLDNRCPHCGAKVDYNPKDENFKCEYCGNETTLEEMKKFESAANEKNNQSVSEENVDNYEDYISYTCKDCGAEIIADKETTATFCVYCGNSAILKNKLSGKFSPSKIIPFKKERKEAIEAFKSLAKGRPLVPSDFTSEKNIEKIRGIYIPFWFHNFNIDGSIKLEGRRYDHWSVGNTDYTRTNIFDVERGGSIRFESVPIDGSTRFDDALMNTIQPYDYSDLVPYNHAYLAGFLAERYDVEKENSRMQIEPVVLDEAKNQFLKSTLTYSSTSIKSNTLQTKEHSIEYVLLPVYMVNVKYLGKMYTFAMNGQTGEFIGNIPVNRKKAVLISILTFVISFFVVWLVTYILFKVGV